LPCKDELLPAQERIEKIIDLFRDRAMSEQTRRLGAAKDFLQPCNELRRAVKQPKRLVARRKIDVDLHDCSAVHQIGNGRHGLDRQCFGQILQSASDDCRPNPQWLLWDKHASDFERQVDRTDDAAVKKGQRYVYSSTEKLPHLGCSPKDLNRLNAIRSDHCN